MSKSTKLNLSGMNGMIYGFRIAVCKNEKVDELFYYSKDGKLTDVFHAAMIFHQRRRAGSPDFYKSWEECPI